MIVLNYKVKEKPLLNIAQVFITKTWK